MRTVARVGQRCRHRGAEDDRAFNRKNQFSPDFCGSVRTSAKKSLRLLAGTLGVVLTISGPSESSDTGVKSFATS